MLKRNGIALAITAGTITLLAAGSPAGAANEVMNMFKDFLNRQVQQPQTADPISQKDTDISNKIIQAINGNKLSSDQIQSLKTQYDAIKATEARYRSSGGGLDQIETASLSSDYTRLDGTLNSMLSGTASGANVNTGFNGNGNFGGNGSFGHNGGFGGNNGFGGNTGFGGNAGMGNNGPSVDSSEARFQTIAKRITESLGNGRLTPQEATALKAEFDRVTAERDTRKADGYSAQDAVHVDSLLDDLQRRVASNTHDSQVWPGINGQQAIQSQELSQGLASGRLTQREYAELRGESDRIAQAESRARANGLQFGETLALANDLFNLRTRIDQRLNNNNVSVTPGNGGIVPGNVPGSVTFDNKRDDIMRRIERGLSSRQLTTAEAEDLRGDFRRLEQLEATYRASQGGLTSSEVLVLQRGLDNINVELNERLHDNNTAGGPGWGWGGRGSDIDRKQADLRRRIDEGVNSGKLTASEATRLRSQLEWIDSVELTLRHSGGRLDATEEQRLAADLDKIGERLSRLLTNSRTAPNVQLIETKKIELQKRIDDGVATRQLSPLEEKMLRNEFTRIGWMQRRLTHDGTLDQVDAQRIVAELDKLNETLTRELNDRRVAGDGRGQWRDERNGQWRGAQRGQQ